MTDIVRQRASQQRGIAAVLSWRECLPPYLLAVLLFAVASAVIYVANTTLVRFGFPWALFYLLVVAAAANAWGAGPAALVLVLSALFGDVVVPELHISYLYTHGLPLEVRLIRVLLFGACGAVTIWMTRRAQLMHERSERRKAVLETLQRMILPETLANVPGYELSGVYKPASHEEEVGGDFYDFYRIREGVYGLLIGDVMGKGKEAAASTAFLRYSVRAFTSTGTCPAQIMYQLNDLLEGQESFETATLFVGVLDAQAGTLCYSCAGHEPPMLARANGSEETLVSTGPILGVGLPIPYWEQDVTLRPGDSLFLMTDGVTEARSEQGRFLESDGTWRLLRSALGTPSAQEALAFLDAALTSFIGRNSRDDIAMLLLRREIESDACCFENSLSGGAASSAD